MTTSTETAFARLEALLGRPVGIVSNGPAGLPCGVPYALVPYAACLSTREEFTQYMTAWQLTTLIA